MNRPLEPETVAVVILNWNSIEDTRQCLSSLERQPYKNVLPIVVDNASTKDEASVIAREFPRAQVLPQTQNLGFARGVNVAIDRALALNLPYVLLLNNDAWFDEREPVIERLLAELKADPKLGGTGPLVCEASDPQVIQSAGHAFSMWTAFPRRLMAGRRRGDPVPTTRPGYIVGACLLLRADLLRRIGGMDPDYFLYGDDIDLALKFRELGYLQGLVPDVAIVHKKAQATTMWSENHTYTMLRSHLIVARKHAKWYHLPTLLPSLAVISCGLALFGVRNGHPLAIKGAIRAWYDFLLHRWGGYDGSPLTRLASS